jgi:hypothetical protein
VASSMTSETHTTPCCIGYLQVTNRPCTVNKHFCCHCGKQMLQRCLNLHPRRLDIFQRDQTLALSAPPFDLYPMKCCGESTYFCQPQLVVHPDQGNRRGGENSVDPALAHTSCSSSSFPESEQDDELSEVRSFESESVPLS